jgi:hypothetical protein
MHLRVAFDIYSWSLIFLMCYSNSMFSDLMFADLTFADSMFARCIHIYIIQYVNSLREGEYKLSKI